MVARTPRVKGAMPDVGRRNQPGEGEPAIIAAERGDRGIAEFALGELAQVSKVGPVLISPRTPGSLHRRRGRRRA